MTIFENSESLAVEFALPPTVVVSIRNDLLFPIVGVKFLKSLVA